MEKEIPCICCTDCDCAMLERGGPVSEFCPIHNEHPRPWTECRAKIHVKVKREWEW